MRTAAAVSMALALLAGCADQQAETNKLRQDLLAARKQAYDLQGQNQQLSDQLVECQAQAQTLLKLGPTRLDDLFAVRQIRLDRHSGGVNLDESAGDDAIKVYLEPVDSHGDVVKAPGEVTIRLFDLAADDHPAALADKHWSIAELAATWRSGMFLNHYSLAVDLPKDLRHDEITVRVEFLDVLSGKTLSAQTVCKVKLPPPAK